jgi:hypothetical protein
MAEPVHQTDEYQQMMPIIPARRKPLILTPSIVDAPDAFQAKYELRNMPTGNIGVRM